MIEESNKQDNNNNNNNIHDFSDYNFPIDMVYTWVDGQDMEWQRIKQQYEPQAANIPEDGKSPNRWRNFNELYYSIQSVMAFAPWIRKIFIVTDHQRPFWYDNSDQDFQGKVEFIDHPVLFQDDFGSCLPTFNSNAIETQIYRIPDLSEHFIYANDDTFMGNFVEPSDFFTPDGRFKVFLTNLDLGCTTTVNAKGQIIASSASSAMQILAATNNNHSSNHSRGPSVGRNGGGKLIRATPTVVSMQGNRLQTNNQRNNRSIQSQRNLPNRPGQFDRKNQNNRSRNNRIVVDTYMSTQRNTEDILNQVFGPHQPYRTKLKHQMKAVKKSVFQYCWEEDPNLFRVLAQTCGNRFRSPDDIDTLALISHAGLMLGEAVPDDIHSMYKSLDEHTDLKKFFKAFISIDPKPKLFCLNDQYSKMDRITAKRFELGLKKWLPHHFLDPNYTPSLNDDEMEEINQMKQQVQQKFMNRQGPNNHNNQFNNNNNSFNSSFNQNSYQNSYQNYQQPMNMSQNSYQNYQQPMNQQPMNMSQNSYQNYQQPMNQQPMNMNNYPNNYQQPMNMSQNSYQFNAAPMLAPIG